MKENSPSGSNTPVISLRHITKCYGTQVILDDFSCDFPEGQFAMITGKSGRGKSTLLHLIGLFDHSFSGEYYFQGEDVRSMKESKKDRIRNQRIGFIFQNYNLIFGLSAMENILLPSFYRKKADPSICLERCRELIRLFSLEAIMDKDVRCLSGGEQQRIAAARALLSDPPVLLADEPTGNLDPYNASVLLDCLRFQSSSGKTVIMVTHNHSILDQADRVIRLGE